ncbi:MAG: ATP-binding protein [Bacteroidota bacterium]
MKSAANFKIDPRLAALLGESYRSIELAIKELVDNSFDADSEHVHISLPEPYSNDAITIADDGTGMTEQELRNEYLKIANSRFSRKGERTLGKQRVVKGRKGIGKFAGLMVAEQMEVTTRAGGVQTRLTISKADLARASYDLSKINLPIETETCEAQAHGTHIRLSGINDNFTFPNPDKLRQLLVVEYDNVLDFEIRVNEVVVDLEDIPGKTFVRNLELPNTGRVQLRYTIADHKKSVKQAGLLVKVRGKVVGQPQLFGLEEAEYMPKSLQQRIVGEVIADGLEQDVTSDWGAVIENSISYQELSEVLQVELERTFKDTFNKEVDLARGRLQRQINKGLNKLPDFKRRAAKRALDNVMLKCFGEKENRMRLVIDLVMDTFEKDEYALAIEDIKKSKRSRARYADALSEYGNMEAALQAHTATYRLKAIQHFRHLVFAPEVLEEHIGNALGSNLWLLSAKYPRLSTSDALMGVLKSFLKRKQLIKTPHLLLAQYAAADAYVLIQVATGQRKLSEKEKATAVALRDDLYYYFPNKTIEMLVLCSAVKIGTTKRSVEESFEFLTYEQLFELAEAQQNGQLYDWKRQQEQ